MRMAPIRPVNTRFGAPPKKKGAFHVGPDTPSDAFNPRRNRPHSPAGIWHVRLLPIGQAIGSVTAAFLAGSKS